MSYRQVHKESKTDGNSRVFEAFSQSLTGFKWRGRALQASSTSGYNFYPRGRYSFSYKEEMEEMQVLNVASKALLSLATNLSVPGHSRPQASITTLSNEIFFEIFDMMQPISEETAVIEAAVMIRSLSSVCRRFREMILAYPKVWRFMNLGWLGEDDLERHLRLSRGMLLHIEFDYTDSMERVLLHAIEHYHRWVYLRCSFEFGEWKFLDSCPHSAFPSLTVLRICVGCHADNDRCDEVFSRWLFPNVKYLAMWNRVPRPGNFDHASLTTLEYTSDCGHHHLGESFLTSLSNFLQPAASLQTLILDVSRLVTGTITDIPEQIVLPAVTRFIIKNSDREQAVDCFGFGTDPILWTDYIQILRVLRTPNVQNLSMSMVVPYRDQLDIIEALHMAFYPSDELKSLTELEFKFRRWGVEGASIPLEVYDFFWLFPQLRDLSVDPEGCYYTFWNNRNLRLDKLRSLRLRNWISPTCYLCDMLGNLHADGASPEEIYIHSKDAIELWEVGALEHLQTLNYFPNTKVDVIEDCHLLRVPVPPAPAPALESEGNI